MCLPSSRCLLFYVTLTHSLCRWKLILLLPIRFHSFAHLAESLMRSIADVRSMNDALENIVRVLHSAWSTDQLFFLPIHLGASIALHDRAAKRVSASRWFRSCPALRLEKEAISTTSRHIFHKNRRWYRRHSRKQLVVLEMLFVFNSSYSHPGRVATIEWMREWEC